MHHRQCDPLTLLYHEHWKSYHTLVQRALKRQADEVGQLDCQSRHLQEALAALHEEEDHGLQIQRRMVATAEEEV